MNTLVSIGGEDIASANVEWADAGEQGAGYWPGGFSWTNELSPVPDDQKPPALPIPREFGNAVILPDGTILEVGGLGTNAKEPLLFKNGVWTFIAEDETAVRDRHAWAILLPSGRVLSGGGDASEGAPGANPHFQLLDPPYLTSGAPQPSWVTQLPEPLPVQPAGQPQVYYEADVTVPAGTTIAKVVLIRMASITHHADTDVRYAELPAPMIGDARIRFPAPDGYPAQPGKAALTLGWYMAYLLTHTGIPSVAQFVRLE